MVQVLEIRVQKWLNAPRLFILWPARHSLMKNFKSIKGFYNSLLLSDLYEKGEGLKSELEGGGYYFLGPLASTRTGSQRGG